MEILYLSYVIPENDGRTRELLNVAKEIGNVILVSCAKGKYHFPGLKNHFKLLVDSNAELLKPRTYLRFLKLVKKTVQEVKNIDILFLDNFFVSPIGLFLSNTRDPKITILDCRELYTVKERKGFLKKIFALLDKRMIKKADIVIAANEFRAQFMKDYYQLESKPLVFENIWKLECNKVSKETIDKYSRILQNAGEKTKIISTGGYDIERGTDRLVRVMKKLDDFFLFIVGGGSEKAKHVLENIVEKEHVKNVCFVDEKLSTEELAYFITNCDIGVVNYHSNDLNNKFCAPGKIYEFLFCGKPVITTENPPLIEMCQKYGIGEADEDFYNGLLKIASNYELYSQNVRKYIQHISIEENRNQLVKNLEHLIELKISSGGKKKDRLFQRTE